MAAARSHRIERVYVPVNNPSNIPPDDTEFAGEYVLRVLPDAAHRAAAARAAADPAFAAEVRLWEDNLVSLTDDIMPVVPSAASKAELMNLLFGADAKAGFFGRLGVWKGLSGALAAAVAALAIVAFVPDLGPQAPRYVSEIAAENDNLRILAVYDAGSSELQITRTAGQAIDGRSLQLWCIVEGKEPWSVGVLATDARETLSLPVGWIEGAPGWSLAISDEPLGGSTTGQPSGDILASTPMTRL